MLQKQQYLTHTVATYSDHELAVYSQHMVITYYYIVKSLHILTTITYIAIYVATATCTLLYM